MTQRTIRRILASSIMARCKRGVAEGTYTCANKPAGRWAATIYQTK